MTGLHQVSTHYSCSVDQFFHSDLPKSCDVVRPFLGNTFNSSHRFSAGLKCRHWLDHSRTLKCFNSNSFVAWVMSFRSLSCWNIQTHFVLHDLTNRKTFYPKSHQMAPSILSFFSLVVLSLCRTKSSKARGYSEMAISNLCSRCTNSLHIINQFLRCFFWAISSPFSGSFTSPGKRDPQWSWISSIF